MLYQLVFVFILNDILNILYASEIVKIVNNSLSTF